MLGQKRPFFPQALANRKFLSQKYSSAPPLYCYLDLSDSAQTVQEKTDYWELIKEEPFDLQQRLEDVCLSELEIHVKSCVNLLKISLDFQADDCLTVLGKPEIMLPKHAPLLHLFAFVSLGSFVHECYRLFGLHSSTPIHAIMPPTRDNVSVGEVEYTSYLCHQFPGQYITAFSSEKGQRRITKFGHPTVVPDAYGVKDKAGHLHLFNGCW